MFLARKLLLSSLYFTLVMLGRKEDLSVSNESFFKYGSSFMNIHVTSCIGSNTNGT